MLRSQETNQNALDVYGSRDVPHEYSELCRQAATESIVLLKNDNMLPLAAEETVSVFGRVQCDYFHVGYGSGGDVIAPYLIGLMEGMHGKINYDKQLAQTYAKWCKDNPPSSEKGWGKWPTHFDEMPLTDEIIKNGKNAIIVLGRNAGEDRDSVLEPGSYYLTDDETDMLAKVTAAFDKVCVIINSGTIIDLSWLAEYKIDALLYCWQGGMESGNAICDILCGEANPSGKLPATVAKSYDKYPSAGNFGGKDFNRYVEDIYVGYRYFETLAPGDVLFPFGFGLSYTTFEMTSSVQLQGQDVYIDATIKNTGRVRGKEIVQIYFAAPQGVLGKPARALAAFGKTQELEPGATEVIHLNFSIDAMASYDDGGKTGHKSAYILEAGAYDIYAGACVRSAVKISSINIDKLTVVKQLSEAAACVDNFQRITVKQNPDGSLAKAMEDVPQRTVSLKQRIEANLPKEIPFTGDKGYTLADAAAGTIDLDTFIAQLTPEELEGLTRGDYQMNSPHGPAGNAGVFGGVTASLRAKGILPMTTTDGPSGIRLKFYCALLPCGVALASTWNRPLLQQLAMWLGREVNEKGSHVLLGPGMNIMRDPLCGRNFEYFSEDPTLTGKLAASIVIGLQKHAASACPKHYACNNQETNRIFNDSRLSERALREIYLKGFEICVKEAAPKNIMTSYNKINGAWGHYHYELCTTILRGEWGYDGNILTDWWMRDAQDPDFPALTNNAYRVRAQVDVLMPGGTSRGHDGDGSLLLSYGKKDGITLAEMQRVARNVLKFVLSVHCRIFLR